jgi:type I restriction enzyme S subunit
MQKMAFKDFIVLQRGFDLPKREMCDGPYPVVGSTSVIGFHNEYKIEPPGVVTGRSGSLGFVQYITTRYWPHNTSLWVKDFKGNIPGYVYYYLKTLNLQRFNSGAGVPTLNRNDLDTLEISIHTVEAQHKITAILSAYDDQIENNQRRIKIMEEIAQNLYREWFVKFRFPGYEKAKMIVSSLGMIPEGWEVKRFTDVISVLSGGTPKTSVSEYWNGAIRWFTPRDIGNSFYVTSTERMITKEGLEHCSSKLYPPDTVFITARGTVGKCVITAEDMAMSQTSYALVGHDGITQFFVYLLSLNLVDILKKNATGAVFDTIIVDTFSKLDIITPSPELLKDFTDIVSPTFIMMKLLIYANKNLIRTRDLLLPKLISGEIDVSDLDIRVEEAT